MIIVDISPRITSYRLETEPEPNLRWSGPAPVKPPPLPAPTPLDRFWGDGDDPEGLDTAARNQRNADRPLIDRSFSFCLGSREYA